jgi:hypothetical protein
MSDFQEKQKLVAEFQAQLAKIEEDISKNEKIAKARAKEKAAAAAAGAVPGATPAPGPPAVEIEHKLNLTDTFTVYEQMTLADGRVLRRYDTGAVRVENPKAGVIQEERVDGSLLVSLPTGTVIFQEFRGEPLLVYNVDRNRAPGLARVSSAVLPGETTSKFVFFFQDEVGVHLVELGTLRYYKVRPPARQGG